jgi:hypothetical protein
MVTRMARSGGGHRRRLVRKLATCAASLLALSVFAAQAGAAETDPLAIFAPSPPSSSPPAFPPDGYLDGVCGLAVDSGGRFYVSDYNHGAVDVFTPGLAYASRLPGVDPADGPCGLALDSAGHLYVEDFHGRILKFGPSPGFAGPVTIVDGPSSGVAVDLATGDPYVDHRTYVAVFDSAGNPVEVGGEPLRIGEGALGDGYGLALSAYPGTAGFVYVADAATDKVEVYDPGTDPANPVASIAGPPGGFTSLHDSALAVDDASGDVYVLDRIELELGQQPRAVVDVFEPSGAYLGHLKYAVVDGSPSGLAVDNSGGLTQGRVYVSSGNSQGAGVYVYSPGAAVGGKPLPPSVPPPPLGGGPLNAQVPIGGPARPGSSTVIACEGDDCQALPPEPVDPPLDTLLPGLGNPKVRYHGSARDCAGLGRTARRLRRHAGALRRRARDTSRPGAGALRRRAAALAKRSGRLAREARRCRRGRRPAHAAAATASAATPAPSGDTSPAVGAQSGGPGPHAAATGPSSTALPAGFSGFEAHVRADGGGPAVLAGSHPYQIDFAVGLGQGAGGADLRDLGIVLPAGLLADPAATPACAAAAFSTPRSSPFEASESGENCPPRSQVGTLEVQTGAGPPRRFGLFNLNPANGAALRIGASPYGQPVVFEATVEVGDGGTEGTLLSTTGIPASLHLHALEGVIWGTPWAASHNGERGNCLNEEDPDFPWAKCWVGEPNINSPLAFLTLPTSCGAPLTLTARASSWQQAEALAATAVNSDSGGAPAPLSGCEELGFQPHAAEGRLSSSRASSASGFVFRFSNEDPGLADPAARIHSHPRTATVALPQGVTLNPSLGAGLGFCTPAQLAAERASEPQGTGCPNGAKIGVFSLRAPFYEGILRGAIYLAQPDDPATPAPGSENPFDSLLAVYLVAKSADRGILIRVPGKLTPDPGDGTLTAVFEDLPQFPYTDLEVNFRSGQRAPLVSPPACGAATTRIRLAPWAGSEIFSAATDSPVETGLEGGPCPAGTPPLAPGAIAGGVNSNVGSYTPYFVHFSRADSEQEITSYSLVLPRGITGRLAGIPFCSDAAIAAARWRPGFAEAAAPSCPATSEVGRTLTGYGVGPALTYAAGHIYLAGPYHGSPLSLVTIDPATVGPFDLGTIVIRSAFDVDPRTAQLQIDSRASDPIPHILDGVVLHLRDIRVYLDRPQFVRNPTSCEPSEMVSTLTGAGADFSTGSDDSTATVSKPFQLLNCLTLGFQPKLGLRLLGGTRRSAHPALRAVLRARPGDASLKRFALTMSHSLFLAANHIRGICGNPAFAADACPANSIYGKAVVHSSLFSEPLRGPVYLRSSTHRVPDLVASLHAGAVRIILEGHIGNSKQGGIVAYFDEIPDAPIESFVMQLNGGRHGLLVNSVDICAHPPQATVKALGQNNRGAIFSTTLLGRCKKDGRR